jgi:acyl-CoA reductase-like NAD-dependent aldehyde dehydrogenase
MREAAFVLRANSESFARMMTLEMGKPIREARAEVEKSALGCEYYADHGPMPAVVWLPINHLARFWP